MDNIYQGFYASFMIKDKSAFVCSYLTYPSSIRIIRISDTRITSVLARTAAKMKRDFVFAHITCCPCVGEGRYTSWNIKYFLKISIDELMDIEGLGSACVPVVCEFGSNCGIRI